VPGVALIAHAKEYRGVEGNRREKTKDGGRKTEEELESVSIGRLGQGDSIECTSLDILLQ